MKLYIVKGENPGRELVVDKSEFTIGREVDNDFVISEVGVSRRHCRLSLVGGEWLIEDCHSVNGILVNGQKVDGGIILRPNDKITVFSHVFRFLPDDDARAADPRRSATRSFALGTSPEVNGQTTASIIKPNDTSAREAEKAASRTTSIGAAAVVKLIVLAIILVAAAYLIYKLRQTDDQLPADPETTVASQETTTPDAGAKTALLPETAVTGLAAKPIQNNGEDIPAVNTPADAAAETKAPATAPSMFAEPQPRPQPRKPTTSTIVVRSEPPGAEVFVDKTSYGVAPAVVPNLTPGRHLVELQLDGYEDVSRQIQLPEDNTNKPFAMHLRAGVVLLTSNPAGASVWHGRQLYGVTPLLLKNLPEGQYDFSLHGPGCEPYKVTATVSRAKGEVISADLKSTLGSIAVTSRPPGCRVYLDGIFKGVTSADKGELLLTDLAAGPATMKVEHPSGVFTSGAITIAKGTTLERSATLWVPTHSLTLIDGKKIVGLLLEQNEHGDVVLEDRNRRAERFLKPQITDIKALSNEEIADFFKSADKDGEKNAANSTTELSRKDDFSMSAPALLQELKRLTIHDFNEMYKGKQILLTGQTTLRQQQKGDKTPAMLYFGHQICARLALGTSAEDWEHISAAAKNNAPISVRGICDGIKDKAVILDRCIVVQ